MIDYTNCGKAREEEKIITDTIVCRKSDKSSSGWLYALLDEYPEHIMIRSRVFTTCLTDIDTAREVANILNKDKNNINERWYIRTLSEREKEILESRTQKSMQPQTIKKEILSEENNNKTNL